MRAELNRNLASNTLMGNLFSAVFRSCKGARAVGFMNDLSSNHEGIRIVRADNSCGHSAGESDLCICVVTWNMNGQASYEDMKRLLVGSGGEFDLLVVGLQEAPRSNNISRLLQAALLETHILLGKSIMQSLQLYVFGPKMNSERFVYEVKVDKYGVGGLGGLLTRKKGAVGVNIIYKGVRMLFICCHLSAHPGKVEERNWEYRQISKSLFSKNQNPYARPVQVTVWLGDLNYRVQGIDTHPARNLIQKNLHRLLTRKDQLLHEAERGQIFPGYCEGTLEFKPTYKYNIGSSNYDTSYKVRVPSWTDRILFKIEEEYSCRVSATLHSYQPIEGIYSSDHKPVMAHLCLRSSC